MTFESEEFLEMADNMHNLVNEVLLEIKQVVNCGLAEGNIAYVDNIIAFLESEEGTNLFQFSGVLRKIYNILCIIKIEKSAYHNSVSDFATNYNELIDEYDRRVFSLRRILMKMSHDSYNEAKRFIRNRSVSPYSVCIILREERFFYNKNYIVEIKDIMSDWNESERHVLDVL